MKKMVLGTWQNLHLQADKRRLLGLWEMAIEAGIQHFDTADSYDDGAAELLLGELLKGVHRANYELSSKCFFSTTSAPKGGLSEEHVQRAVAASLVRLNTQYLDVYFAHRDDPTQTVAQIATTFNRCIAEGTIRQWGICRWAPSRVAELFAFCKTSGLQPPIAQQFHYHLFNREAESLSFPLFSQLGLSTWAYSPLAQGILTNKYHRGISPATRAGQSHSKATMWDFHPAKISQVAEWSQWLEKKGWTPVQAAIAFCASRAEVSHVLIGATNEQQLDEILSTANLIWQQEIVEVFDAMST